MIICIACDVVSVYEWLATDMDYAAEQEMELEALEAILMEDLSGKQVRACRFDTFVTLYAMFILFHLQR